MQEMKPQYYPNLLMSFFLLSLIAPSPALSATGPEDSILSSSLRVIWGLLIVVGILFIIYGLMKKKMQFFNIQGKGAIKVIEVRHLMPKKSLYLVEVRGQEYLLGASQDRINLIAPVKPASTEPFAKILQDSEAEGSQ